jgi:hypothetical protein
MFAVVAEPKEVVAKPCAVVVAAPLLCVRVSVFWIVVPALDVVVRCAKVAMEVLAQRAISTKKPLWRKRPFRPRMRPRPRLKSPRRLNQPLSRPNPKNPT